MKKPVWKKAPSRKTTRKPTLAMIVCGDREWSTIKPVIREFNTLREKYKIKIVIHGAAPGADEIGAYVADSMSIPVDPTPAEWMKLGKAAGPIRNGAMLKKLIAFKADEKLVLAFHPDLSKSKGTKDMVTQARKVGVYAQVVIK